VFSFVSSLAGSHKASRDGPSASRTDTNRDQITEPSYTTQGDATSADGPRLRELRQALAPEESTDEALELY